MGGHRRVRPPDVLAGVLFPQRERVGVRQAVGNITVELVVGRGLVGQDIRRDAAPHELGQDIGGVAQQGDREGLPFLHGRVGQAQGLVEVVGHRVDVARLEPALDPVRIDLDHDGHAVVHGHGQRLGPAHAAEPGRQRQLALERAAEMFPAHGRERLVRALQDALRADIDPAAGRHLAVHGEAQRFEPPELVPVGPVRHDHGVGDEDPGRLGVGLEHGHRFARLDDEGLVVLELLQAGHDGPVGLPVAGRFAGAAVDDELGRLLGHLRVQVVHEHPQGAFLRPALGQQAGTPGGPDVQDGLVAACFRHFLSPLRGFEQRIYHSPARLSKIKKND